MRKSGGSMPVRSPLQRVRCSIRLLPKRLIRDATADVIIAIDHDKVVH